MRLVLALVLMLLPASLMAQEVRSLGEATSPLATIGQVAWLAGSWEGEGFGGQSHESWLPPVAGQMAGVFHQSQDGEIVFYEILQIVPRDGSLVVRLKHFNGDLSGWEDNSAQSALEFPLVAIEGNTAYFSGLTYRLVDESTLHIYLAMRNGGEETVETFAFTRIDDRPVGPSSMSQ